MNASKTNPNARPSEKPRKLRALFEGVYAGKEETVTPG